MDHKKSTGLSACFILAAGILWGTMGLFVRLLDEYGLSSLQIAFLRSFFSFLLFFAFVLITDPKKLRVRPRDLWCFLGTGVCSLAFFNFCYFTAITLTSLSTAAVLLYTEPAILTLLSAFLFHEKFTARKGVSLALTLLGCVLVTGIVGDGTVITLPGLLFGLGAGIGYALYSVFGRYALLRGYHPLTVNAYTFLFSAVVLSFFADFPDFAKRIPAGEMPWLASVLLAVVASALPYFLYTAGLRGVENGKAAILASVEPVVATLIGFFLYREKPDFFGIAGIVLVLGAVVLMNLPTGKPSENGTNNK